MFSLRKKYHTYSDAQLLPDIARGKEAAFNELYKRYSERMHSYFFRMLYQNATKADDFAQDLFMKVIEHAERFDPSRKFSTWVYTIASNMCKNEYRRISRRNWHQNEISQQAAKSTSESSNSYLPDHLDKALFTSYLARAISELEMPHRQCFILRYQEELSIKEISAILDCPEGTVKSRIHYSLKKLSPKLKIFNPRREKKSEQRPA